MKGIERSQQIGVGIYEQEIYQAHIGIHTQLYHSLSDRTESSTAADWLVLEQL